MSMASSPTPWVAEPLPNSLCYVIRSKSGTVAYTKQARQADQTRTANNAANATLIVEAANDHATLLAANAALVNALQDVKARIERSDEWWMAEPTRGGFDVEMIDAALLASEKV